jgi:aryl-alcohol dehydrogenase-like predicted oxidoreductase
MPASDLPTRRLGRTDLHITRVGFGAWAIGGAGYAYGWGRQDDGESAAAVRYAVEHGVNWIDTAPVYGLGHSEKVVGAALAPYAEADRPYLFTKCGLTWDETDRSRPPRALGTPNHLRRGLEGSLRRLGVERIDLYQLHWPRAAGLPLAETWQTLLDLRREGKVRAVGLVSQNTAGLASAAALGRPDAAQPPFSAIDREAAEDLLGWCAAHEVGVLAASPMQYGLLTGAFTRGRVAALPADDWRRGDGDFIGAALDRNLDLARRMGAVAHRRGRTLASVAVAWTLAWPGVTAAIVGARRPDQVRDWLPAAAEALDDDDLDEIAEAIERSGAGAGPTRPPAPVGPPLPDPAPPVAPTSPGPALAEPTPVRPAPADGTYQVVSGHSGGDLLAESS